MISRDTPSGNRKGLQSWAVEPLTRMRIKRSPGLMDSTRNRPRSPIQGAASAAEGAGFKVVYAKGAFPAPPAVVGDYAPYAQALVTANAGKAPDVIYTTITPISSLSLINLIKTGGYTGTFMSPFYSPILLKALSGAYVFVQFAGYETKSKGIDQFKADVEAVKPNFSGSITLAGGYFGADFFIAAVKQALKTSKTITTASIKKAAAAMTYQIKDTIGPTSYPKAYKGPYPSCTTLLYDDGNAFNIVEKFFCTNKKYKVQPKFANG